MYGKIFFRERGFYQLWVRSYEFLKEAGRPKLKKVRGTKYEENSSEL